MNPNSAHQLWSRWDVTVTPPRRSLRARLPASEIQDAWARFVSKSFQTRAGQVRCERKGRRHNPFSLPTRWIAQARLEGVPAHDPVYRDRMKARIVEFFGSGFGNGTQIQIDVRIEAGDLQDGAAAAQLLMLPTLTTEANHALVPVVPPVNRSTASPGRRR